MMGRILVTGASGYVGGRLVKTLSQALQFKVRAAARRDLSSELPDNVEFYRLDDEVTLPALRGACDGATHVIHLASPNEIEAAQRPLYAVQGTVGVTTRLVEAAHYAGVSRLLYLSTAHVYGRLEGKLSEATPTLPHHPYARTHRAAEDVVLTMSSAGPEALVVRLSNAIGAPTSIKVSRWSLVANDVCRQVMATGSITLRSAGLQYRDFIPMQDAVNALCHLLLSESSSCGEGIYNVGLGRSMSVRDLVHLIASRYQALTGHAADLRIPSPSDHEEMKPFEFDVSKLRTTGFQFTSSIEQEIDETLALCKQQFTGKQHAS